MNKIVTPHQPSQMFIQAFKTNCAGCVRDCVCGRINFDVSDNMWDWEEGELEMLMKKAEVHPDKYVKHDNAVGTMNIDNNEVVIGCLCDIAYRYEQILVQNDERIAYYLKLRQQQLIEKARRLE